jgi:hypothetical protein
MHAATPDLSLTNDHEILLEIFRDYNDGVLVVAMVT